MKRRTLLSILGGAAVGATILGVQKAARATQKNIDALTLDAQYVLDDSSNWSSTGIYTFDDFKSKIPKVSEINTVINNQNIYYNRVLGFKDTEKIKSVNQKEMDHVSKIVFDHYTQHAFLNNGNVQGTINDRLSEKGLQQAMHTMALFHQESQFDRYAVSFSGCKGIGQLHKDAVTDMIKLYNKEIKTNAVDLSGSKKYDIRFTDKGVEIATFYFHHLTEYFEKYLHEKQEMKDENGFHDVFLTALDLATLAYNRGPTIVCNTLAKMGDISSHIHHGSLIDDVISFMDIKESGKKEAQAHFSFTKEHLELYQRHAA